MNEVFMKRNARLAEKVIRALETRNMKGYYAETKADAKKLALSLISEGSSVSNGGFMTGEEIGLVDAVRNGNYDYIDRETAKDAEEKRALYLKAFDADWFLMSANAMTADGVLVNIDGVGNRVAALCYGPKKVMLVVSMKKVESSLDAALERARNTASPANAIRLGLKNPCTVDGICHNCKSETCICSDFVVTRYNRQPDRIHVILVGEDCGY